jgi:Spy/CpxP family protein refolding chaperone
MSWQVLAIFLLFAAGVTAQPPPDQPGNRGYPSPGFAGSRGKPPAGRDRADGKWWLNPRLVERLGLSKEQQRRIEEIFQQSRLKLIHLSASLEREQAILDPLLAADYPQESRVLAQFDRVAEARLELEKANARMLWGFRGVLSSDQWKELQWADGQPGPPPNHLPR